MEVGVPFYFHPRKWHAVQPWQGDRLVMVLYSPRGSNLHYKDRDELEFAGFPVVSMDGSQHALESTIEEEKADGVEAELYLIHPLPTEDQGSLERGRGFSDTRSRAVD